MLEGGVCDRGHGLVRRQPVSLDDDGTAFALGDVEKRAKAIEGDLLVAKINCRNGAAGDADDLLVLLGRELESRKWKRDSDPRLEHEIRAEQEEEKKKKN